MRGVNRREALRMAALGLAGAGIGWDAKASPWQEPGERPERRPADVTVINPRGRVPVSLIIDDSTALVNLAHFAIPQFREVFPDQYPQPWKDLPREIPDAFVRTFGEWCHEHGVKGKYSMVPAPACVGWLDRDLPGWSRRELESSLEVVRTLMMPDWDIHPEMVTHTWVIDTKTGRPFPERSERFMENWRWTDGKSADELANYMSYALRILKGAGLKCEGITTPGGFGNRVLPELAKAAMQSCRDVFGAEIPHYFRHLFTDGQSVAPRVEWASGLSGPDPRCVVSIIGCTGDWFGGWDGLTAGKADQFITEDGRGGRLPEVIPRGEPAVMVCHWPGMYFNGKEVGFSILKAIVARLKAHHPDDLIWMRLNEISRYWAARELTHIASEKGRVSFRAPFSCPGFTVRVKTAPGPAGVPRLHVGAESRPLREAPRETAMAPGTWHRRDDALTVCFDLPKGASSLEVA